MFFHVIEWYLNYSQFFFADELENNADIITISNYQGLELSSILETAWKATWSLRKRYLLSASAGQYLKKFAVLCLKGVGPHLVSEVTKVKNTIIILWYNWGVTH